MPIISSIRDIETFEESVRQAADIARAELARLVESNADSLSVLHQLKFEKIGRHPTQGHALNLVEQVNQTFTILVTLRAARWLMDRHGVGDGIHVALGAAPGHDLESVQPRLFAAEAFAATHWNSNDKLTKDLDRLANAQNFQHRYVFMQCPQAERGRQKNLERADLNVEVWSLPA